MYVCCVVDAWLAQEFKDKVEGLRKVSDLSLGQDCVSLMSVLCGKLIHGKSDAIGQAAASCVRLLLLVRLYLT